jgi:hypothetical protein
MSKASRLIEKIEGAVRPNNAADKKSGWEYACDKTADREPTSWRSIIEPVPVISEKPKVGRGHKS